MNSNTSLYKEEKLIDGVYITRNSKSKLEELSNNKQGSDSSRIKDVEGGNTMNTTPKQPKYFYRSTSELIALLENDFEQNFLEIHMLYRANEEMLEYDPNDYDLIEAREENLEIINKKLNFLIDIQSELRALCPTNPLVTKNVFDFFKEIPLTSKDSEEVEINSNIETTGNVTSHLVDNSNGNKNKDEMEIITDIVL